MRDLDFKKFIKFAENCSRGCMKDRTKNMHSWRAIQMVRVLLVDLDLEEVFVEANASVFRTPSHLLPDVSRIQKEYLERKRGTTIVGSSSSSLCAPTG